MLLGQVSPAPQWMEQKSGVPVAAGSRSQKAANPATELQTPVLAQFGLYTAASGGGTAIVAPTTLTGLTSPAKLAALTIADATTYKTAQELYPRRVVSQGSALSVTYDIEIEDLTGGF